MGTHSYISKPQVGAPNFPHIPAAPYLKVKILHPTNNKSHYVDKALLDTGADLTLIPEIWLQENLNLYPVRTPINIGGLGQIQASPYVVSLMFDNTQVQEVEVWGWQQKVMIIGRDLMNKYRIEFNGLGLTFSISCN